MPNFIDFLAIEPQAMWAPHLWEEESDIFLKKIIISDKISTIKLEDNLKNFKIFVFDIIDLIMLSVCTT